MRAPLSFLVFFGFLAFVVLLCVIAVGAFEDSRRRREEEERGARDRHQPPPPPDGYHRCRKKVVVKKKKKKKKHHSYRAHSRPHKVHYRDHSGADDDRRHGDRRHLGPHPTGPRTEPHEGMTYDARDEEFDDYQEPEPTIRRRPYQATYGDPSSLPRERWFPWYFVGLAVLLLTAAVYHVRSGLLHEYTFAEGWDVYRDDYLNVISFTVAALIYPFLLRHFLRQRKLRRY